jgi:hypothetical protein
LAESEKQSIAIEAKPKLSSDRQRTPSGSTSLH